MHHAPKASTVFFRRIVLTNTSSFLRPALPTPLQNQLVSLNATQEDSYFGDIGAELRLPVHTVGKQLASLLALEMET
jgi:hypothetical protein